MTITPPKVNKCMDLGGLDEHGFAMLRGVVSAETLFLFRAEVTRLAEAAPLQAHGIRRLLHRSPPIAEWAHGVVCARLPSGLKPVRAIFFDKTPDANWKVSWHQDLTIAVHEKHDLPGYGPWSVKDGIVHVQPPIAMLENMITLRLHLDDTPFDNGALKVIPRSHRHGRLDADVISTLRATTDEHICEAGAGDILLMKPLILHASSAAEKPAHRRVVHVEYARPEMLHPALSWSAC